MLVENQLLYAVTRHQSADKAGNMAQSCMCACAGHCPSTQKCQDKFLGTLHIHNTLCAGEGHCQTPPLCRAGHVRKHWACHLREARALCMQGHLSGHPYTETFALWVCCCTRHKGLTSIHTLRGLCMRTGLLGYECKLGKIPHLRVQRKNSACELILGFWKINQTCN